MQFRHWFGQVPLRAAISGNLGTRQKEDDAKVAGGQSLAQLPRFRRRV